VKTFRLPLSLFLIAVLLFFPFRILQAISLLYLVVLGLSFAHSHLLAGSLVVRRHDFLLRAHRFDPLQIILTIENRSPFPVPEVSLIDTIGPLFSREPGKFVIRLRPWEKRRISYTIESQHRGEYSVGPASLLGSDPLGFFPWKRSYGEIERLIIYPEVLPLRLPLSTGLPAGNVRSPDRLYEDLTRYRSLREYVPGDDARKISWKVSARMGSLHTMEYVPFLFAPVLILMNMNSDDYPFRFRSLWVERAAVLAASLVMHFVSLGQEIGLIASASLKGGPGLPVVHISGAPGHAAAILETLARMDVSREPGDFTRLLYTSGVDIPVRTHIKVISPMLTDDQHAFLREVKQKGSAVELFLLGGDALAPRELLTREFPLFVVSEYGNELLDH
jgi:uncharacterized protein (DUF58 family)